MALQLQTLLHLLLITILATLPATTESSKIFFPGASSQSLIQTNKASKPKIPYEARYFPQVLDHFTFKPKSSKIFYQKYLINNQYWHKGAPIFVYTGNEGDIEWFAANTGFMLDIAPKFKALLFFIEHRFYGESLPFGKDSYKSAETLGYLNSQQALADFAVLIRSLKHNLSSEASPVVVFGGSYGGRLASAFYPPQPPHGRTFFGMPAGRSSDGRLIIDFIAKSLKLPYLSAYLNCLGTNFTNGANFATAASTFRIPTSVTPAGGFSPFSLLVQYSQFSQFINRSRIMRQKGGVFAKFISREECFGKALYIFDIGRNDNGEGFFGNMTVQEGNASVPAIVGNFSSIVKSAYELGGRSFWIHNTGPIGCLPYIAANFPSEEDSAGCAKSYNEVAQHFNSMLKETVTQLKKDLPSAAFTYVDVYSIKYSLFKEPQKYGFELPFAACGGYGGGKYNFREFAQCGQRVTINGTEIFVGSCDRPEVRVNWDGIHYTEVASKFILDQISTGSFSDPPVPLTAACHSPQ